MNSRYLYLIILLFAFLDGARAQVVTPKNNAQISLADLKPAYNFNQSSGFFKTVRKKPGLAFLSSAIIPGSGQAVNGNWIRAGAYFLAEAALVGIHFKSYNDARAEQRRYHHFANKNWSVLTYAQWLVNYHDQNNLKSQYIDDLRDEVAGKSVAQDSRNDWAKVNIGILRKVEEETPFVYPDRVGNNFSHDMPDYGSQQYYELISKYFQFGPGWNDFGNNSNGETLNSIYQLHWDGRDMPYNFVRGAELAKDFNDSYRLAGNMISLIILNHIVSAFDAFLTAKIRNNKLETETDFLNPEKTFTFRYHF